MNDFDKKPDKKKEPFTYSIWRKRGMLGMSPEERLLMNELADMNATSRFLFRDEKGNSKDWWKLKDMRKFVKYIIPRLKEQFIKGGIGE